MLPKTLLSKEWDQQRPCYHIGLFPTLFLWKIELQLYPIFKNKHTSIILPQNKSSLKPVVRSTHLLLPTWLSVVLTVASVGWEEA